MDNSNKRPLAFVADGGKSASLSASPATITVQKGKTYVLKSTGAGACVRFGGAAGTSDGAFDFVAPENEYVTVRATSNSLSCVEASAAGSGTLYVAEVDRGNSG